MSTHLICPDCGGVIGATEPGVTACTCFADGKLSPDQGYGTSMGNDTGARSLNDTQPIAEVTKFCIICGKNVAGHRRIKDSRGYLCVECNQKEVNAEKEGTVKCASCSRRVKEAALVEFRGLMICKLCREEQKAADKKKVKVISSTSFENQERKTLRNLLIVAGVLVLFMLLSWLKRRQ